MTPFEFDNTKFTTDTKVSFRGKEFSISKIDFARKAITYTEKIAGMDFEITKDCEALEIVKDGGIRS